MIAIDMKMPICCGVCDFKKSDPYSGEVYCSKAIGSNTIIYEKERLENCPLVAIVTCKDCKYYRVEDDDEYCTNHTIKDNKFWVREDYFCADGERKE